MKETPLPGILERVAVTDIKNQVRVARRKYPTLDVKYIELPFQVEPSTSTTAKRSSVAFSKEYTAHEQSLTETEKEANELVEMTKNGTEKEMKDLARVLKTSSSAADYDTAITGDGGEDHSGTAEGDEDDTGVGGSLEDPVKYETVHEVKSQEMMDEPTRTGEEVTLSTPTDDGQKSSVQKFTNAQNVGHAVDVENNDLELQESTSVTSTDQTTMMATERLPRAANTGDDSFHTSGKNIILLLFIGLQICKY